MKDKGQDKKKEQELLPSERVSRHKEGLYVFISILILFAVHILVTLILRALLGK